VVGAARPNYKPRTTCVVAVASRQSRPLLAGAPVLSSFVSASSCPSIRGENRAKLADRKRSAWLHLHRPTSRDRPTDRGGADECQNKRFIRSRFSRWLPCSSAASRRRNCSEHARQDAIDLTPHATSGLLGRDSRGSLPTGKRSRLGAARRVRAALPQSITTSPSPRWITGKRQRLHCFGQRSGSTHLTGAYVATVEADACPRPYGARLMCRGALLKLGLSPPGQRTRQRLRR
jgi:hypothetical protein